MKNPRIYLDNNATTFLDPNVKTALSQFLEISHGNPSSLHVYGQDARSLLDSSRRIVASYFKVQPQEVIFTSSGSEAMNLLIHGFLDENNKGEIITSNIEHSSVKQALQHFRKKGFTITELATGLNGFIDQEELKAAIGEQTKLIVLMAVNNETGVKNDIEKIAFHAKNANVPCVVDGVALLGKEKFTIPDGIIGMGFSGHKIHALQGIGVAIVRSRKLSPMIYGSQEHGRRGGTENLIGIVSFAEAIKHIPTNSMMAPLRDKFETLLQANISNVSINGLGPRVSNTSNIAFDGVDGESLLIALDQAGVAASHGSACTAGALEPSPILLNMGIPLAQVRSSIRFSLSRFTTEEEIEQAAAILETLVKKLRK